MEDGKIYITISDKRDDSSGVNNGNSKKEEKQSPLSKYVQHQFFDLISQQAKQTLNYSVNNIGNFTGEYQTQRQIQSALNMGKFAKNLVVSAYSGFKLSGGNPMGAAVAVGLQVASTISEIVQSEAVGSLNNKQINYKINALRERSGLNTLNDGSRGTEN